MLSHSGIRPLFDTLHDAVVRSLAIAAEGWAQVSALASDHPVLTFQTFAVVSVLALNRAGSAS